MKKINFKPGMKVKIKGNSNGHGYKIGQTVTLLKIDVYSVDKRGRPFEAEDLMGNNRHTVREMDIVEIKAKKARYSVDEDFIREAHAAACSEWKAKLEKKYPKVFDNGAFDFGEEFILNTNSDGGKKPVFIGREIAPDGLENKCLMVADGWEAKMVVDSGRQMQIITFERKK